MCESPGSNGRDPRIRDVHVADSKLGSSENATKAGSRCERQRRQTQQSMLAHPAAPRTNQPTCLAARSTLPLPQLLDAPLTTITNQQGSQASRHPGTFCPGPLAVWTCTLGCAMVGFGCSRAWSHRSKHRLSSPGPNIMSSSVPQCHRRRITDGREGPGKLCRCWAHRPYWSS